MWNQFTYALESQGGTKIGEQTIPARSLLLSASQWTCGCSAKRTVETWAQAPLVSCCWNNVSRIYVYIFYVFVKNATVLTETKHIYV